MAKSERAAVVEDFLHSAIPNVGATQEQKLHAGNKDARQLVLTGS
jgi:hypothetical protein